MAELKRYNIGCPGCGSPDPNEIHSGKCPFVDKPPRIAITENETGEWVRYADVTDTELFIAMTNELSYVKDELHRYKKRCAWLENKS